MPMSCAPPGRLAFFGEDLFFPLFFLVGDRRVSRSGSLDPHSRIIDAQNICLGQQPGNHAWHSREMQQPIDRPPSFLVACMVVVGHLGWIH
jgi:hypothetical protein